MVKLVCWVFVVIALKGRYVSPQQTEECSESRRGAPAEGNMGSAHAFPWLGVLRVHLHHETPMKIALTGLVLVKENYAIANADDIAKIPKQIFKEDSRAMFIPEEQTPWFCRPVDYMTHPEYELDSLSSIALVELELPPETSTFPMKPACWPPFTYNSTINLYAVGYTDENQALEKYIYKLKYVEQDPCREFYNRAGLTEGLTAPVHYTCGLAPNNHAHCVWDNGMVLVSNSSGRWVLIGLGLHGPGCSAPARFLSVSHYLTWIHSATDVQEIDESPDYRKSAFSNGFSKHVGLPEYIPAHALFRSSNETHKKHDFAHHYPYDVLFDANDDLFQIDRASATEIKFMSYKPSGPLYGEHGDCSDENIDIIYQDFINVTTQIKKLITIQYKVAVHNSLFIDYTCVTMRVRVLSLDSAFLYYEKFMHDASIFPETPDEIIRVIPIHTQTKLVGKKKQETMMPSPIKSSNKKWTAHNVVLYLKVEFKKACQLEIRISGPVRPVTEEKSNTTDITVNMTNSFGPSGGFGSNKTESGRENILRNMFAESLSVNMDENVPTHDIPNTTSSVNCCEVCILVIITCCTILYY